MAVARLVRAFPVGWGDVSCGFRGGGVVGFGGFVGALTALKMEIWPGWAWTCSIMKVVALVPGRAVVLGKPSVKADLDIREGSPLGGFAPNNWAVWFSGAETPYHAIFPQSCCHSASRCGVWIKGYIAP